MAYHNRVKLLEMWKFDRDRKKTKEFLMSERLYFHLAPHEYPTLSAKIIHVIIRLTKAPHDFFELIIEDFIKYENKAERRENTNKLFQAYANLKSGIRQLYGNQNEKRDVKDEIT